MKRRDFLKTAGAGAAALATAGTLRSPRVQGASRPPNIVFIMADDLGYGHLGCYGQRIIRTPNIDKLAAGGTRFTQCYAGCAVCAPSRSVLMTGYHTGHTTVRGNSGGIPLRANDLTVAEILKEAGYRTGLFGKWGLGDAGTEGVPNKQGFDEFFGYLHQAHAHHYYTDYLWQNDKKYPLEGNAGGKQGQYSHDVILDKALDFLHRQAEQPFFLCLTPTLPHHEWIVPDESLRLYSGKFEEHPLAHWRDGYALPAEPKATMAGMITHLDKGVGKVVDLLDELGLRENTLVIFTSDNGGDGTVLASADFFQANGPLRGLKGSLYEGGIRVPMIANWPGHVRQGATDELAWYFADIMPTFAELAGAESKVPSDTDGISVVPTLLSGEQSRRSQKPHDFLYWEQLERGQAVRKGDWKAIKPEEGDAELYSLGTDPVEEHNVAAQHADIVAELLGIMAANHVDPPPQDEPKWPDGRRWG